MTIRQGIIFLLCERHVYPVPDHHAAIVKLASGLHVTNLLGLMLAPISATVGILTCLSTYNDFLLPLIMISNPEQYTLPLVQYVFQGQFNTDFNLAFASHEKKTGLSQKGTLK